MADDTVALALAGRCPCRTLVELKLVSRSWRACARRTLHAQLGRPPAPPPPPPPPPVEIVQGLRFDEDEDGEEEEEGEGRVREAVVIDVGGAYTKAGLARHDAPLWTFPTVVARCRLARPEPALGARGTRPCRARLGPSHP